MRGQLHRSGPESPFTCPFPDRGVDPHSLLHKVSSLPGLQARHPPLLIGPRLHVEVLLQMYNIENHWSFDLEIPSKPAVISIPSLLPLESCPSVWLKSESETEQDPRGLLGTEAFPCSPFLVCREQTPASMTFPESQRAGSNSC